MKLRDYLSDRRITQETFAQRVGLSQGQVSRVVNGTTNVSGDVLRRIAAETGGEVTPNDVLGVERPTPETAPTEPSEAA